MGTDRYRRVTRDRSLRPSTHPSTSRRMTTASRAPDARRETADDSQMTRSRDGRVVAIITVAAGFLVVVHSVLWDAIRYRDGTFLARDGDLVTIGAHNASLFR